MPLPTFIEARFPVDISYGSSGGPKFNTTITETQSGDESRVIHWAEPLCEFEASTGIQALSDEDGVKGLKNIISLHRVCYGQGIGFRYKDWSDYSTAPDHQEEPTPFDQVLGTGDGVKVEFQMSKEYTTEMVIGSPVAVRRDIKKPVPDSFLVAFGDTQITTGFTVDYTKGLVTFSSAPADGIEIRFGCEFDVPVRFNSPQLDVKHENYRTGSASISLKEIRIRD